MKNRFTITESEKGRILGLHEQANPLAQGNALTNSTLNTGNKLNVASNVPKIVSSATPEQKKLIDAANSWVETNKSTIPKTVAEITKFLNDKVTAKQLTPEALPYVKATIQSNSNGTLVFPKEETGGQPTQQPASTPIDFKTKNPKIETIQTLLNTKYKANLTVDGKLGPKTIAALQSAIATKLGTATQGTTTQGTTTQGTTTQGTTTSQGTATQGTTAQSETGTVKVGGDEI